MYTGAITSIKSDTMIYDKDTIYAIDELMLKGCRGIDCCDCFLKGSLICNVIPVNV